MWFWKSLFRPKTDWGKPFDVLARTFHQGNVEQKPQPTTKEGILKAMRDGTYVWPPAPKFSSTVDGVSIATIYTSHYDRLHAVVAAARSGNARLIRMALAEHDRLGFEDEPRHG